MIWRWISSYNFFVWLQHPNDIERYQKSIDENIRSMMEMMNVAWDTIMYMPYKFFMDTLKWKIDLEEEKKNKMEEKTGKWHGRTSRGLQKGRKP